MPDALVSNGSTADGPRRSQQPEPGGLTTIPRARLTSPPLPAILSGSSSTLRSRGSDGNKGQDPGNRSRASRTSPLLLTAPSAGPLPSLGRPERECRPNSSAGHPIRVCGGAGFRCSTFISVQALSHTYLLVFTCGAWEFGVLAGSFYRLWTELSLERPFTAPS
ncbi:hypothetical protein NDU88_005668 [Pleurodeles waltl]|uniref:Uncharacterized protein n=1 Tax=Pleurodeles waltl TaxID=8319 RepID=A0AAV7PP87_PLEWA|nr:hypothetical protein NDU88_005668 [Pleurodeles waltl]